MHVGLFAGKIQLRPRFTECKRIIRAAEHSPVLFQPMEIPHPEQDKKNDRQNPRNQKIQQRIHFGGNIRREFDAGIRQLVEQVLPVVRPCTRHIHSLPAPVIGDKGNFAVRCVIGYFAHIAVVEHMQKFVIPDL